MMKITSVYATDPHTTIGGAEAVGLRADQYFIAQGHTVEAKVRSWSEDSDLIIFNYYDFEEIRKAVIECEKSDVYLIGHRSFYCNWLNIGGPKPLQAMQQFRYLFNQPNFCFVALTENDYALAKCVFHRKEHIIWGRQPSLPPLKDKVQPRTKSVGFSGRITQDKGAYLFTKLKGFLPSWEMRMTDVYSEDDPEEYARVKSQTGINFYQPDQYDEFWKGLGVLCMCSKFECMPVVLQEALQRNIPVVMFDCVVPDVQFMPNAVKVVPQNDLYSMAKAIKELEGLQDVKSDLWNYYNKVTSYPIEILNIYAKKAI